MPLPPIESYPMPDAGELPANRMSWEVDPDRCVLLIHDMQRYFLDAFPAEGEPVASLVANIGALRRRCADLGIPRVYTAQPGSQRREDRGLLSDLWGEGLRDDPAHTAIVDGIAPAVGETVITKWRYSAFVHTDLERRLREWGRDQLIVCGVYARIGVVATACDAFMRDFPAFIVADAVADFCAADHAAALSWAARRCARTMSAKHLLEALAD